MIRLYIIFILTYFSSCFRFLYNDINNFGKNEVINIFFISYRKIMVNIFIIQPISMLFLLNYNNINYILILPEIFFNYFIYDFIHHFIHKKIQESSIHQIRHNIQLVTFTSTYAHPLDYFLLNVFPVYIGLFLMKAHIITYYYFTIMETYILVVTNTKMGNRSRFHLNHKIYMDINYGINMQSDIYFHTYFP